MDRYDSASSRKDFECVCTLTETALVTERPTRLLVDTRHNNEEGATLTGLAAVEAY